MDLREKSKTEKRHPWELARFEVIKNLLKNQIIDYSGKNILDLGCGDLFFIKELNKRHPSAKYYAVDTAFDNRIIDSEKNSSLNVYKSMDDLPENETLKFDVIFLMDVIEHINDDLAFLKNLVDSQYVSQNTIFVITVPAFQRLFSNHDHFLKHYRRYNNRSLESTTTQSGLQTIEKGYFFFSLLIPRYIESRLDKVKGHTKQVGTGLTNWDKPKFITDFLKNFLLVDYRIHKFLRRFGIKTPGLSNYIICKQHV